MQHFLPQNNTLLIRGPASFRLLSGDATVLGARIERGHGTIVTHEKQVPVEARSETHLEIVLGKLGKLFEVEGSTIPSSWRMAADTLAEMKNGKVIIVGMTDVGKSTLCTYLTNTLLQRRSNLRIVDADIGQADIGPPTTIGAAIPTMPLSSLIDLQAEHLIFIGDTTPTRVERRIKEGVLRLSGASEDSLTIINTDGWILDPLAISYKIELIDTIKPDLVVALAAGTELEPILAASRSNCLRLEVAKDVLSRSRGDRRKLRTASYRRFLKGARTRIISSRQVEIVTPNGLPFTSRRRRHDFENRVVGLLDNDGYMLHLGVLMNSEDEILRVYCRSTDNVRRVEIGYVKLSTDGKELRFIES